MNYQSFPPNSRLCFAKGQHHLLLLRGISYLLPLSLLSGGVAFPQSFPDSQLQSPQNLNQDAASSLDSLQASQEKAPTALPDYESVTPMQVNESDNQPKQTSSQSQSSSQSFQKQDSSQPSQEPISSQQSQSSSQSSQKESNLKPIQPLVNSSSSSQDPQTSSGNSVPQWKSDSPQKTRNTADESSTPTVDLEQRESEQPTRTTTAPSEQQPSNLPKIDNSQPREESSRNRANQDFVDLNGYPQAGERSLPAPKVEVSDRDSKCTTVIEDGKLVSGNCNLSQEESSAEQARVEPEKLPALPKNFEQPNPSNPEEVKRTYTPPEDLPQLKLPGNGNSQLLFPLATPSAISADYGWRLHPVVGERRFHTGTDFAAPEGTPVVATKSGRVTLADYRSGYGLIVGLRHNDENESRYAHLSQIHVRPGKWVEQGTVIGRVGSTGLSTGPHLHFEWRIRQGSRWVAVNAEEQLLMARANLNPNQLAFRAMGDGNKELSGGNFLAYLPQIVSSFPKQPASWMSVPQLDFLQNSNFNRAYERKAPLASFSERAKSVLVLPFSLPEVLASVFNWQPPQLFAEENLQRVPTYSQIGFGGEFTYRPPSPNEHNGDSYHKIARFLEPPETLESATDMKALGTLNFPSPHQENPQQLSDYSLKDNHVPPKRRW